MEDMSGWQTQVVEALEKLGFEIHEKRNAIWAWKTSKVIPGKDGQPDMAYGCELTREPLGGGAAALALRAKEIFLEKGKIVYLDPSERSPVSGPLPEKWIRACLSLADRLVDHLEGFSNVPVEVVGENLNAGRETSLVFGQESRSADLKSPWNGLRSSGFLKTPEGFGVILFLENPEDERARGYANFLKSALCNYGEGVAFEFRSFADSKSVPNGSVGLVGLQGEKGTPLQKSEQVVMDELDRANCPYRAFSLSNQEMKWSAFDQAASLIYTAGGTPYALELPWPEGMENTHSIGIDLSHPIGTKKSILAVSLIDPRGLHVHSWRFEQARSENADLAALKNGLEKAKALVAERSGKEEDEFLVVRDGRRNKSERVGHYREVLGRRMTFVDLSKRSSCHMYAKGARPTKAWPGTVLYVGELNTPFLLTIPPVFDKQMVTPQKVLIREDWDGLGLGIERVCALLTGMCYAPSLGMKPHRSPAPVYWADGIASIKPENCQFRGQRYSQVSLSKKSRTNNR
jgi:hypothetical protein